VAVNDLDEDKYVSKVAKLLIVCQSWFSEFTNRTDNIVLFTKPFNYPEEKISYTYTEENLQLEIVDRPMKYYLVLDS